MFQLSTATETKGLIVIFHASEPFVPYSLVLTLSRLLIGTSVNWMSMASHVLRSFDLTLPNSW
jgi:hypothetical protein